MTINSVIRNVAYCIPNGYRWFVFYATTSCWILVMVPVALSNARSCRTWYLILRQPIPKCSTCSHITSRKALYTHITAGITLCIIPALWALHRCVCSSALMQPRNMLLSKILKAKCWCTYSGKTMARTFAEESRILPSNTFLVFCTRGHHSLLTQVMP